MKTIITKFKNLSIVFLAFFAAILFFTNAEYTAENIISTIQFCYNSLIPSLFPLMVFSTLISRYTLINKAFSIFFNKISSILGICIKYFSPIIFGNISGFVTGPKILSTFNELKNQKNQFSRLILLSSNAGMGFVISFVGKFLWGNVGYGLVLYFFQILISIILNTFLFFKKESYSNTTLSSENYSFCSSLTFAISSSATAMISICSFTIVFSALSRLIIKLFKISTNSIISIIIFSFFDVTEGVRSATNLENSFASAFFVGFSIGFGGISIAFQIFSLCDGFPLYKFKYLLSKLIQGILCGFFSVIYVQIFDIKAKEVALDAFTSNSYSFFISFVLAVFLIFSINYSLKARFSKKC